MGEHLQTDPTIVGGTTNILVLLMQWNIFLATYFYNDYRLLGLNNWEVHYKYCKSDIGMNVYKVHGSVWKVSWDSYVSYQFYESACSKSDLII